MAMNSNKLPIKSDQCVTISSTPISIWGISLVSPESDSMEIYGIIPYFNLRNTFALWNPPGLFIASISAMRWGFPRVHSIIQLKWNSFNKSESAEIHSPDLSHGIGGLIISKLSPNSTAIAAGHSLRHSKRLGLRRVRLRDLAISGVAIFIQIRFERFFCLFRIYIRNGVE